MIGTMSYTQLTREQRYQIYSLLKEQHTLTEIAKNIGVHKSTISREVRRNTGHRGYRPEQANKRATARLSGKSKPRITNATWLRIETLISEEWSPEQISHWLRNEEGILISHEWIYLYIYQNKSNGGDLHKSLRCQKKRRKRYGSNDRRGALKNRVSIDERPAVVELRNRFGDWEADTVAGQQSGPRLVTLVERKSRFTLVGLAADKSSESVTKMILKLFHKYKKFVNTITYDNGKEFAGHLEVAQKTDSKSYFAHPYHSWERGLNENTNGLLRQYFPKGSDFLMLRDLDITKAGTN